MNTKTSQNTKSSLPGFLTHPLFASSIGAIIVGLVVISFVSGPSEPKTTDSTQTVSPSKSTAPTAPEFQHPVANNAPPGPVASTPVQPNVEPWEKAVDDALDDKFTEEQSRAKLLALMPTLPDEGKVYAMENLVDLVEDKDYKLLEPYILDPKASADLLDTMLYDLYDRSDALTLPLFLKVYQNSTHPLNEDAKDYLMDYVEEDYGNDYNKWNEAIQKYLKENPEE